MRILFANKFLYPKGGSETHLLGLADALVSRGHEIDFFGLQHPENVTPPHRTTTIPETEYCSLRGWQDRVRAFAGMLFSTTAYHRVRQLLKHRRADVAHLHNIYHQLSPSVLVALRDARVPCVLTAHDYKLVCPSYSLHDGQSTCFACRGHQYWNLLSRGCSRQGAVGSVALVIEAYVHHFLRLYEQQLDAIIAPSRFVRDRLVEGGFAQTRVQVLPNALAIEQYEPHPEPGDYVLFIGRLSYEKGLPTLIAAAKQSPDVPLWLAGDGPLRVELERQAEGFSHIRFLGPQPHPAVRRLLQGCRALVLASEVPENCPMSVLEAFATAKPAIATRVGGVPELFAPEPTGITVPPGDPAALAAAMRQLWNDPDLCWHCGIQARQRVEARHNLADYLVRLEGTYHSLARTGRLPEALDIPAQSESPNTFAISPDVSTIQRLNASTPCEHLP